MAIFAPALSYVWQSAKDFGLNPEELFREAGIDPALRLDLKARVTDQQMDALFCIEKQKAHDSAFVFKLAEHLHPSYLGAIGYAWLSSSTLRNAFQRLVNYSKLIADELTIQIEDHDGELHVVFQSAATGSHDPALRERVRLTGAVRLCRMNCGNTFNPLRVIFQQAAPSNQDSFEAYFRSALQFDSESTVLVIDAALADAPLSGSNAQLVHMHDQMIIDYLARLDKLDIVGRTKALIFELLPSGHVSIEEAAGRLNMSARSLSRKLKQAGVSFKELLAETRKELGKRYIQDSNLTLTEISFLLGFAEMSSFSRAFRTWTGQSPSDHRKTIGSQHMQEGA